MFHFLGHVVRRGWPFWLVGWVVLLVATWLAAPSWSQIAQDQEFSFLPPSAPSRVAADVYAKAFPTDRSSSNIVLVLHRSDQGDDGLRRDLDFINSDLEPGLRKIAEDEGGLAYEIKESPDSEDPFAPTESKQPQAPARRSIIARIRTPNAPEVGALLVSPDRSTLLVDVDLVTDFSSHSNWPVIDKVQNLVQQLQHDGKVPPGTDIALTGSAVIGRDHSIAELGSIRATGILTVVLVAVLLIFIYRAPLLAVIPLVTVYVAVQLSLNVLALLGKTGYITLFQGLQIYITILAYGAGVDYCLFLTARYKEELDRGAQPKDAAAGALGNVGAALVASAATVMCGIAMMMFAQFGKFREAGFAIPLTLLLVLLATLTFSPSLLCLAGRWAFWPHHQRAPDATRSAPERFFGGGRLERMWDRLGQLLLRRAGVVWLLTVAFMVPFAVVAGLFYNHLSYDVVGDLPADSTSTAGTRLLQQEFPAGIIGPVTVLIVDPQVDFGGDEGKKLVAQLTDRLRSEKEQLGLADIRSLTAPLGVTQAAGGDFFGEKFTKEQREEGAARKALDHYTTDLGERARIGTRLDLVLNQSPFSRQSMDSLGRIEQALRDALPEQVRQNSQVYFVGTTASVRDLSLVMKHDRQHIEWYVLACVFVILALLLRGFVTPLYLLVSVLFSYFTTLGVAFAVFWALDPHGFTGIDWKVAIFLFTILIAVGEDYNIFLMTRVREEQRRHGPERGITEALDRTGPIISSCGIIMAGTFASLVLSGKLIEMKQLGFALAFGVLLDTFVVRPILVPAFLILQHRLRRRLTGRGEGEGEGRGASPLNRQEAVITPSRGGGSA